MPDVIFGAIGVSFLMENKNVFIALLLMLAVWTGYTVFFVKPSPTIPVAEEQSQAKNQEITPLADVGDKKEPMTDPVSVMVAPTGVKAQDFVVETDDYRAVFSNVGARLKSLELKKYRETLEKDSGLVSLVGINGETSTFGTTGQGDIQLPVDYIYSTSVPAEGLNLKAGDQRVLRFTAVLDSGVVVEKNYSIKGNGYDLQLDIVIHNQGSSTLQGNLDFLLVQPWFEGRDDSRYSFVGPAVYEDGDLTTYKIKKLEDKAIRHANAPVWTAFEDKHFLTAAIPLESTQHTFVLQKDTDTISNIIESGPLRLDPNQSLSLGYLLYAGPRDLDILKGVNYELDKAIDFGFFDMLARPLLSVLQFCYNNVIQNYGVAIILLTGFIKILFWPLTHKSYKSMRDMQKLQPEMQRLREKYKTDKERMNREIMELYRNNRVNPMGGCLPMFAQIPVFFALYKVLLESIALRHEPFIFWIQDLSAKDPYYITPIIMGVTMFIQQKMSPTTMDSQQAKIMLFMPIIFTFMFLNFPSGLVLYWLVNNILTITQQWFINRGATPSTQTA
jgi:YidC/Oxa1 family membrane protein insertase